MKMNRDFIYTIPESVLFDTDLTLNDLKIYMIVRSFLDTTGDAYPSNNWIANKIGVHRVTAINCINRLIERHHVYRIIINGKRHLTVYKTICEDQLVASMLPPSSAGATPPSSAGATLLISNINNTKDIKDISANALNSEVKLIDENYEYPDTLYPQKEKNIQNLNEITKVNPHNIPDNLIREWRHIRKAKITPTVWNRLNKEITQCKCSPIEAFEEMISRGWSTLKADWINKDQDKISKKQETFYDHTSTEWINDLRGLT